MIIPFLNGIGSFRQAPMTWLLCFFNCLIFVATLQSQLVSQNKVSHLLDDQLFVSTQAYAYAQFVVENSERYSDIIHELARGTLAGSKKKTKYLANMSFRDASFIRSGYDMTLEGDQVAIAKWRGQAREMASARREGASARYGLSSEATGMFNFISYEFMHGDTFHLLSNMFFLLIFGVAIEPLIGALGVLTVFVIGGIGAAGVFILVSGLSALPLIGASGSVSAMMGVFAALYQKKPVKFFFWVMPAKNYVGFIFLPAWVAVAMWVCMDFAGLVGTLPELGGTAHAAHLGGVFLGFSAGYVAYILNQRKFGSV